MIRAHQLIEAIKETGYETYVMPQYLNDRHLSNLSIAERIVDAQKFDLTNARGSADAVLYGIELMRSGISPYPYEQLYLDACAERGASVGVFIEVEPDASSSIAAIYERCNNGTWRDACVAVKIQSDGQNAILMPKGLSPEDSRWKNSVETKNGYAAFACWIMGVFALLSAGKLTSSPEAPKESASKRRLAQGRPPLFDHHVIRVPAGSNLGGGDDETHASPRLHWRRGHVRNLSGGGLTRVRPHLVGDASRGFVSHDYTVE